MGYVEKSGNLPEGVDRIPIWQYNEFNPSNEIQRKRNAYAEAFCMQKREGTEDKVEELKGNGRKFISLIFESLWVEESGSRMEARVQCIFGFCNVCRNENCATALRNQAILVFWPGMGEYI